MSTTPSYTLVVVGFDFSHSGRAALERAVALAARAPFHVLHFVCVIDPHIPVATVPARGKLDYVYAERVQDALTDEIQKELRAQDVKARVHFNVHARFGKPAEEILGVAKEVGAELIVVGSKGLTGVERLVLGSVSEKIVREAGCTVEVARPNTYAHVVLLEVTEKEAHKTYVPPHRYYYEDTRVNVRPAEWPIP